VGVSVWRQGLRCVVHLHSLCCMRVMLCTGACLPVSALHGTACVCVCVCVCLSARWLCRSNALRPLALSGFFRSVGRRGGREEVTDTDTHSDTAGAKRGRERRRCDAMWLCSARVTRCECAARAGPVCSGREARSKQKALGRPSDGPAIRMASRQKDRQRRERDSNQPTMEGKRHLFKANGRTGRDWNGVQRLGALKIAHPRTRTESCGLVWVCGCYVCWHTS